MRSDKKGNNFKNQWNIYLDVSIVLNLLQRMLPRLSINKRCWPFHAGLEETTTGESHARERERKKKKNEALSISEPSVIDGVSS